MDKRRARRLPGLDSLEYSVLLVGLIVMVAFSFVSAVYAFSVAWVMPIIFLALYMILRVLVPLRGAEPGSAISATRSPRWSDGLTRCRSACPPRPFSPHRQQRVLREPHRAGADHRSHRVDVTYFRTVPPSAFAQEKSQQYFRSLLE